MTRCVALIVASGRGRRFGSGVPKQYVPLAGAPLLRHTLRRFAHHPEVAGVRAVIHPDDRGLYDEAAAGLDLLAPVTGGETRQDSGRIGLESLADDAPDKVLIHDGARPLIEPGVIDRVVAALDRHEGAVPALPVADTLKRVEGGRVGATGGAAADVQPGEAHRRDRASAHGGARRLCRLSLVAAGRWPADRQVRAG